MKNLLITGGTGNLGQAVVDRLLAEGYRLILGVSPQDPAPRLSNPSISYFEVDLLDEAAAENMVQQAIQSHGDLYGAVMLVGGFAMGAIAQTDRAALERMFQLNFLTAYHLTRPLLEHFSATNDRRQLIFVGSRPALKPAEGKNMVAYSLSKSLLFHLADMINAQSPRGPVSASVLVPSTMDTPANRAAMPDAQFEDWAPTERVAETIAFLLSPTGEMLRENVIKVYNKS